MILANGMVGAVDQCIGRAVTLLNSGPAAAPSGAAHLGSAIGLNNVVSMDMGGTSFDVVLVKNGVIPTTSENWGGEPGERGRRPRARMLRQGRGAHHHGRGPGAGLRPS